MHAVGSPGVPDTDISAPGSPRSSLGLRANLLLKSSLSTSADCRPLGTRPLLTH